MTRSTTRVPQELLGYRLEARIGAGAFGEVWRAQAPGGVPKAVKLVFGYFDDTRAQRELRALHTVRNLRHPFLLSLERFEVVEGQLVVITELADESLKDRFHTCSRSGLPGIPREELLGFLADAADGLDYLSEKHLLQHLDVKPENLLLVGSHVKVGDYGLVKDIRHCSQSLMGGMTPAYAAPELFDGRPSQLSDQYSLAIVYQEMLTGVRPFSGTTPAQLANQHLTGAPQLEALPRGDQPVIARALSKDPSHRYRSCTELIQELQRRRKSAASTRPASARARQATQQEEYASTSPLPASTVIHRRKLQPSQTQPPLECDGTLAAFHPTLLVGIGTTGAEVVERIKQRLRQRLGSADDVAALQTLCLDTDQHELDQRADRHTGQLFRDHELLAIPLKSCEAYRKHGLRFSQWLSRRWIYNIPRTRNTEGLRPLGRLAFADHAHVIQERLHTQVQQLVDGQGAEATARALGLPLDRTPRVFVLGTSSGGLGSGMIADLAYLIRAVLLEHGLPDKFLTGVLLHGTGHSVSQAQLATANSYAFLRELSHYAQRGYPGDATLNLPSFDDEEAAAFSDLYFIACGREAFATRAAKVGDYLFLDLATGCNDFFKRCRTGRDDQGRLALRTLGLSHLELQQEQARQYLVRELQLRLLSQWIDGSGGASPFEALAAAQQIWQATHLTVESIMRQGVQAASSFFGPEHHQRLLLAARELCGSLDASATEDALERLLDGYYAKPSDPAHSLKRGPERDELILETAAKMMAHVWSPVVQLLDDPEARLSGAFAVYQLVQRHLQHLLAVMQQERQTAAEQWRQELQADAPEQARDPEKAVGLRSRQAELHCSCLLIEGLIHSGQEVLRVLESVSGLLRAARALVHDNQDDPPPLGDAALDLLPCYQTLAAPHLAPLTRQLQHRMDQEFFGSSGNLQGLAASGVHHAAALVEGLGTEARRLAADCLRGLDFETILQRIMPTDRRGQNWLKERLRAALPELHNCGGEMRMVLVTPPGVRAERWETYSQQLTGYRPTVVPFSDGDLAVLLEGQGMSAGEVAAQLIAEVPSAVDYLDRVPTRLDVEWMPLTGLA